LFADEYQNRRIFEMANTQNAQSKSPASAEERLRDNNEDPAPWRPAEVTEKSGSTKAATVGTSQADKETGDPGRTPGSAEGVEDFEETGNE
jgi:hypothetical protein